MDANVIYKDIPGFPGYRVGADGSVWSMRMVKTREEWRRVKPLRRPYGAMYSVICLRPTRNGKLHCRYVHRLVLEAFVGKCPEGMVCCHRDGDTANNRLENLRWGTQQENCADMIRHGTNGRKLTLNDVAEMMAMKRSGSSNKKIADWFGVHISHVGRILRGESWKDASAVLALDRAGKLEL